jgi:hypothetical protein
MVLYGCGVKPERPFFGLLILLSFFSILYLLIGVAGNSTWEAFNTSLIVILSGTKLIDNPIHPAPAMFYWVVTLERLLGYLFFAWLVVSVGRIMR